MLTKGLLTYLGIVNLVFIILVLLLRKIIKNIQTRRVSELKEQDQFDPVEVKHHKSKHVKQLRNNALESLIGRFSIIRRIFIVLMVIVWLIALSVPFLKGISATFISLIVTATSVILGIAARPYIENIISGIVISLSKQLNTGDTIMIDNHYSTVEDITISHTVVKIWDQRRYIIPNSVMLQKEFINYSIQEDDQWAYVSFWISYDTDIKKVKEITYDVALKSRFELEPKLLSFWTMDMTKEGIECWLAVWTIYSEAWIMRCELRTELIMAFQQEGIKTHSYNIVNDSCKPRTDLP